MKKMMKPYGWPTLWLLALLSLSACKKESMTEKPDAATPNLRQWLKTQLQSATDTGRRAGSTLPPHKLLWERTSQANGANAYLVPASFGSEAGPTKLYLTATTSPTGEIAGGKYVLCLPNRKKMGSSADSYDLKRLLAGGPATGFSGALLYYNTAGQLMGSQVYENGQPTLGVAASLATREADTDSDPSPNNVLQDCEDRICIEWFLQTFLDGVMVYEEYITTTCGCNSALNGGGGSLGFDAETACNNALDIFVALGRDVDGAVMTTYAPIGPDAWEAKYNWEIYRADTWRLNSFETGILKKNVNTGFEFQDFRHDRIQHAGVTRGGTRTYQDLGAIIDMRKYSTRVDLAFTVTSCVPCNANNKYSQSFIKTKTFSTVGVLMVYNPD
jgi:hypothetical protein